jgi:membrane-bound ClpP family serine protease
METKQIAVYLIIAGAVILVVELFWEIISYFFLNFWTGLGFILLLVGAVVLALNFIKENKDDAKDEPFRGIDK